MEHRDSKMDFGGRSWVAGDVDSGHHTMYGLKELMGEQSRGLRISC
jgi:hypothetical protein